MTLSSNHSSSAGSWLSWSIWEHALLQHCLEVADPTTLSWQNLHEQFESVIAKDSGVRLQCVRCDSEHMTPTCDDHEPLPECGVCGASVFKEV